MFYWAICGVAAAVRLLVVYCTQPRPAGKDRPRVVPWQSVARTLSVLWTCSMMSTVNVGGIYAAAVYFVLILLMFASETPAPRAAFMMFVTAYALRIDVHTVVICLAAAGPDVAMAVLELPIFN